jgi:L,D-peptidoglycan transpeptidase YkuD (ErfK/YbiS/YcfS/YnhG family)
MKTRAARLRTVAAVLAAAGILGGGLLVQAPPAPAGTREAVQETNPCERLNAGQVLYPGYGAHRVTFATTADRSSSDALVTTCVKSGPRYVQDWQSPGYVGRNGFRAPGVPSGHTEAEFSPTGSYSVTDGFGLWNPGTRLRFQILNSLSRWGGGGEHSADYNRYFESSSHDFPDEDMWDFATRPTGDYRQGVVLNYNRPPDSPIREGAGFAIFLHSNPAPTAGCIALPEALVTRYLKDAVPGDRVIMGAVGDVFTPYSADPTGPITSKYTVVGGQVALGRPVGDEVTGLTRGGKHQNFERGTIRWSADGGAHVVRGAIRGAYDQAGREQGSLGYPISDELGGNGGVFQTFEGGAIYYSRATGARISTGLIHDLYVEAEASTLRLGYPTSNPTPILGGVRQAFQGGTITWSLAAGIRVSGERMPAR